MVGRAAFDYSGESAIVTGSTKGIGRGIAESLAAAGADVAINARTPADVKETVAELDAEYDGTFVAAPGDISDLDAVEKIVETAVDAFDQVDLLVNNAAVWPREESLLEASLDEWEAAVNVNVRSQFYLSKLVAEHMLANDIQGNVINMTSQTGDRRSGPRGLYGLSNTAVNGLTWRMAYDYALEGIRVNAISTDAARSYQLRYEAEQVADGDPDRTADDVLDEMGEQRPIGRLGRPDDIGNAVLYLASDAASYVVGTILRVSGGGNLQGG
ncbi:SDR family NAD(P)-dependent oxidoreductase [Salinarchaeum laminariae]|uniref:SDR family NAD(P)-dependent oxidoreductase n=1 Tax=Salinarchaeum laminariae TaxID=869888 RepID=UPI0020BE5E4F|nr:SDR family oxidoreductase [Salinarchaeum laminariae]